MLRFGSPKKRQTSPDQVSVKVVDGKAEDMETVQLEASSDIHFVSAQLLLGSPYQHPARGSIMLFCAALLVGGQAGAASVLFSAMDNSRAKCMEHDDCGAGDYCTPWPDAGGSHLLESAGYATRAKSHGQCKTCYAYDFMYICHANGSATRSRAPYGPYCFTPTVGYAVPEEVLVNEARFRGFLQQIAIHDAENDQYSATTALNALDYPDAWESICERCSTYSSRSTEGWCEVGRTQVRSETERLWGRHLMMDGELFGRLQNLDRMGTREWVAYIIATLAVAGCILHESRDIGKVFIFLHQHVHVIVLQGQRLSWGMRARKVGKHLMVQLILLIQVWRAMAMALIVANVPEFAARNASDSLSLLLNTAAGLFVLEGDEILMHFFASEAMLERNRASAIQVDARSACLLVYFERLMGLFSAVAVLTVRHFPTFDHLHVDIFCCDDTTTVRIIFIIFSMLAICILFELLLVITIVPTDGSSQRWVMKTTAIAALLLRAVVAIAATMFITTILRAWSPIGDTFGE